MMTFGTDTSVLAVVLYVIDSSQNAGSQMCIACHTYCPGGTDFSAAAGLLKILSGHKIGICSLDTTAALMKH